MLLRMIDGKCKGFFLVGQNPVVGNANARIAAQGAARTSTGSWCATCSEIESAAFWHDSPEIERGELRAEDIGTEVFFLPAAAHTEKDGTLHEHAAAAAVAPQGGRAAGRLPLGPAGSSTISAGAPRASCAGSTDPRDRPMHELTWDYPTEGPQRRAATPRPCCRRSAADTPTGRSSPSYQELKDDGSTTCGSWLHAGIYADGVNQTARGASRAPSRTGSRPSGAGRGRPNRAHPLQPRLGRPGRQPVVGAQALRVVGRRRGAVDRRRRPPGLRARPPPDYEPGRGAKGMDALRGNDAVHRPPGRARLAVRADRPGRRAAPDALRAARVAGRQPALRPAARTRRGSASHRPRTRYHPAPATPAPTCSRTCSRPTGSPSTTPPAACRATVPYLAELQPELFVEVSPELAAERGLEHGGWATIVTARAAIEARVMVTDRLRPLHVEGRVVHQVGLPYHWGRSGLVTGDAANELLSLVLDLNVHISEYKAATCDIRPGRRPRGPR